MEDKPDVEQKCNSNFIILKEQFVKKGERFSDDFSPIKIGCVECKSGKEDADFNIIFGGVGKQKIKVAIHEDCVYKVYSSFTVGSFTAFAAWLFITSGLLVFATHILVVLIIACCTLIAVRIYRFLIPRCHKH